MQFAGYRVEKLPNVLELLTRLSSPLSSIEQRCYNKLFTVESAWLGYLKIIPLPTIESRNFPHRLTFSLFATSPSLQNHDLYNHPLTPPEPIQPLVLLLVEAHLVSLS